MHKDGRRGPQRSEDTHRRPALAPALDLKEPDSAVCCDFFLSCPRRRRGVQPHVLSAAIGRLRYVCYRPGEDGPLGRRSGPWYGRCLLSAVRPACRSSALALVDESVEWAMCRSRLCFHRAGSVSSGVPPVGRGSRGLMPLAARHTATSPTMAALWWLPDSAQIGSAAAWQAWS